MIADLCIHDESDEKNHNIHAHIMTTVRPSNPDGTWKAKSKKEYILDEKGNKVLNKNGKPKTRKVELTNWNDKGNAEKWRENFSKICNVYLEKNGQEKRVDHRSYKRQGKDELPTIHLGASAYALEKKGIETEKGNINREIKKHNELVRYLKNKITEINTWIKEFKNDLKQGYEKYKEEIKIEYEKEPKLFDLYEYITVYHDMQREKTDEIQNQYYANKKGASDLRRFLKARYHLQDNNLKTIGDLQKKISELKTKSTKNNKEMKQKTIRIENLNKSIAYAEIMKDNHKIYEEWKNKKMFKTAFYNGHKNEIDKYKSAKYMIEKIHGTPKVKIKEWKQEIKELEKEIKKHNEITGAIKKEYESINHIKYAVKQVNDDYGIDLSIEIDNAIKRGEKPSTIAQIRKFQEQIEKEKEYSKKAKIKNNEIGRSVWQIKECFH